MNLRASGKCLLVVLVCGLAFTPAAVGQSAPPSEGFSVQIDVFSGRPNPVFTLSAADWQQLSSEARALCTSSAITAPKYPEAFLGYRGMLIRRAGASSMRLARQGVRFFAGNAPNVCRDVVRPTADLVVADSASSLERQIADLAFQKGIVDTVVHQHILDVLNH
jgi:hypothetical protein